MKMIKADDLKPNFNKCSKRVILEVYEAYSWYCRNIYSKEVLKQALLSFDPDNGWNHGFRESIFQEANWDEMAKFIGMPSNVLEFYKRFRFLYIITQRR